MSPFFRQTWTLSGVLLNMVAQGMALSYSSSILPALRDPESPIKADLQTASWVSSSIGIGGLPGFFISSYLMEKVGRRLTHILVMIPSCTGWLFIYFANNVTTLIIGRFLCGFTAGGTVGLGAVVIGEFSSPKHRGMFLNLKTASVCFGGMLVHIMANYLSWRIVALAAIVPHLIAFAVMAAWPESPSWLAVKGNYEKSRSNFFWLRGEDENSIKELNDMISAQQKMALTNQQHKLLSFKEKTVDFLKKFTRKDFLKPVFIILLGSFLIEVAGRHIFPAYALDIMGEITGNKSQSFFFTLTLDLLNTISAICSSVLVKIVKRRTLLFGTGFVSVIFLLITCGYLFLVARNVFSNDRKWIPIGLFVIFFVLVNLGCCPIPLTFLGELLPLAHRGAGSAVSGVAMSLALNLGLQVTPIMLVNCKVYGTFAVFGVAMAIILGMLYFMLPETKDRTLQEIEDFFNFGRFKDDDDGDEEVKEKMMDDKNIT